MTTRTFTVTVVNVSGNNKYFIDGVQQATITLAEGGTYVFNWSAATTHPLRFSTTYDGTHNSGSEYTTGVTKDDSAYTTTILVANSAPTLYYYCQNHPNMGGQINTEASDTWGLLSWGEGNWSAQNDITLSVTGVASTSAVGSATTDAEVNAGWGRNSWGLLNWGQAVGGADVSVTGVSTTASFGTVTATGLVELGWGRGGWGNRVWGDTYSALPSGVVGTTSIGTPVVKTDVVVTVTGVQASTQNNTPSISATVSITPTGISLSSSIGTITALGTSDVIAQGLSVTSGTGTVIVAPNTIVEPNGLSATSSIGDPTIAFDSLIAVSGLSTTSAVGSITPISTYSVTGVAVTLSAGNPQEVTGTGIVDDVTGVVLTSNVGSVIIIAWNRVDTGTPVTWTKITTAA